MLKLYTTKVSAKTAIRKQAIHLVEHTIKYMDAAKSGYYVEFKVDNIEDVNELRSRGFAAVFIKNEE